MDTSDMAEKNSYIYMNVLNIGKLKVKEYMYNRQISNCLYDLFGIHYVYKHFYIFVYR